MALLRESFNKPYAHCRPQESDQWLTNCKTHGGDNMDSASGQVDNYNNIANM